MAENVYEGMFILGADRVGRDLEIFTREISDMIQNAGGTMLVSRVWEERRLAYPIQGHRKGIYWLTYFRLDGNQLASIQRQCRLSDVILRVLLLKIDSRIVDTLVAHAKNVPTAEAKAAAEGQDTELSGGDAVAVAENDEPDDNTDDPESIDDKDD